MVSIMPRTLRTASCLLLAAGLALVPPASAQKRFADVTEVVVVDIPVQVVVDGQPVRGLTAADFEVRDGRKKRQILDFEAIDLGGGGAPQSPVEDISVPARRHFLLLFDLALSQPGAVVRARRAARKVVAENLHPTDLVGVAVYSARGSEILLGFTPDREQIEIAIDTLGMRGLLYGAPDPLGIVLSDQPPGSLAIPGRSVGGIDTDAEILELLTAMQAGADAATDRNSILALSSSLGALAQMIGAVQGRKHVVLFSEGFNSTVPLGLGMGRASDRGQAQAQAEAAMTGQVWEVNSDARFGDTSTLSRLDQMSKEFVRSGAAVHSVDIGGLRAGADVRERRPSSDGLFLIADKTGGEFYRNYNDLGDAMQSLLDRTSVTYVLTIQPEDLPLDGRYRNLTVKLKRKLRGARVVHRPGYFAPKPFSEQSGLERRLTTAQMLLGDREGGRIAIEVETAPLDGAKPGLSVSVAVDGTTLLAGQRGKKLAVELFSYALDSSGAIRDFISRNLMFDLDKSGEQLRRQGYLHAGRLELPHGDYTLRTLVRNTGTGQVGLRSSKVSVPAG